MVNNVININKTFSYSKCEEATDCPQYYRGVLAYACGGSALLGIIALSYTIMTTRRKPLI